MVVKIEMKLCLQSTYHRPWYLIGVQETAIVMLFFLHSNVPYLILFWSFFIYFKDFDNLDNYKKKLVYNAAIITFYLLKMMSLEKCKIKIVYFLGKAAKH